MGTTATEELDLRTGGARHLEKPARQAALSSRRCLIRLSPNILGLSSEIVLCGSVQAVVRKKMFISTAESLFHGIFYMYDVIGSLSAED